MHGSFQAEKGKKATVHYDTQVHSSSQRVLRLYLQTIHSSITVDSLTKVSRHSIPEWVIRGITVRRNHGEVHDWADSTLICSLAGVPNLSNPHIIIIMLQNLPTLLLDVKSLLLSRQHYVVPRPLYFHQLRNLKHTQAT